MGILTALHTIWGRRLGALTDGSLLITKTDGSLTYTAGDLDTYTIVVSNSGPSFVTGATVADTVPANISGDSDSTASIAGSICGALLGRTGIPAEWVDRVQNRDLLVQLADGLDVAGRGEDA